MSDHKDEKLGAFLREVSNWSWEEFAKAEHDETYSSNEAIIFAIIRSCAMQKMEAIRMSLNRLDGKLKTPIAIEYPKIFYVYPNAKLANSDESIVDTVAGLPLAPGEEASLIQSEVLNQHEVDTDSDDTTDLPSLSLRETLTKMSDYPRELPRRLVERALEVEQLLNAGRPIPEDMDVPRVKSVVAAHLLTMAADRNLAAAAEVFDQIDGKLAETIQILGEDLYITNYSYIAPDGATPNQDGVLQIEATAATDLWAQKLKEFARL